MIDRTSEGRRSGVGRHGWATYWVVISILAGAVSLSSLMLPPDARPESPSPQRASGRCILEDLSVWIPAPERLQVGCRRAKTILKEFFDRGAGPTLDGWQCLRSIRTCFVDRRNSHGLFRWRPLEPRSRLDKQQPVSVESPTSHLATLPPGALDWPRA